VSLTGQIRGEEKTEKWNFISIRIWRVVIRGGGYLLGCNPALFHVVVDSSISSQMLKRGRKKKEKSTIRDSVAIGRETQR
jgi:hypothetical protein